jgi:hypothetical protein
MAGIRQDAAASAGEHSRTDLDRFTATAPMDTPRLLDKTKLPTEPAAAHQLPRPQRLLAGSHITRLPRVPLRAQKDVLDPKLISPTMEGHE